jgi:hypothetical protein
MALFDNLANVPNSFKQFCQSKNVVYSDEVRRDMLAAALSSQLVLLAGPSGTGKSTGAAVLADFFTVPPAHRAMDVRPLWTGPDGLVGYYSPLTLGYEEADGLQPLLDVSNSAADAVPFIVLEEANLSPMEVYLGNVITSLSGLGKKEVRWQLHRQSDPITLHGVDLPAVVALYPYPRFLATINVDSTADAPSPKVCGRGLTLLLEAPTVEQAVASTAAITPPVAAAPTPAQNPPGFGLAGDPRAAWYAVATAQEQASITGPLESFCDHLAGDLGANYVSPRDLQRCAMFMSWHVGLAVHDVGFTTLANAARDAAELALLHVVLPGLGSGQFGQAVQSLNQHATPGGLLAQRLERVLTSTKGIYGAPPDFWAALS